MDLFASSYLCKFNNYAMDNLDFFLRWLKTIYENRTNKKWAKTQTVGGQ